MKRGLSFFLTVIVLFSGCGNQKGSAGDQKAPNFKLESFQDASKEFELNQWTKDHYVLLAFWATWCPPCVKEIPLLNELQEKYSEQGLKIFGINVSENRRTIQSLVDRYPVNYDILLDKDGAVSTAYGIEGLPVIVLLAKEGQITYYGFSLPELKEYLPITESKGNG